MQPKVFNDDRGFFYESFNQKFFNKEINTNIEFVQDNHSKSSYGTLRGLHYQLPPFDQGKLVRVVSGEVYDVAVDIRKNSPTFGKYYAVFLSGENKKQFWIPSGFAHGFLTLSDEAEFLYKTTNFYSPSHERCIKWDDKDISVDWPKTDEINLSQKDLLGSNFNNADYFDL